MNNNNRFHVLRLFLSLKTIIPVVAFRQIIHHVKPFNMKMTHVGGGVIPRNFLFMKTSSISSSSKPFEKYTAATSLTTTNNPSSPNIHFTLNQLKYYQLMKNSTTDIVFAIGPAGTGIRSWPASRTIRP